MVRCVLYINSVSWIGGAEGALLDLATNLDASRFAPVVVCPNPGEFSRMLEAQRIKTYIVPYYGLRAPNPTRYFQTIVGLARLAFRHDARLIHVNHQQFSDYGVVLGRLCRLPVVVHLRGVETDEFFGRYARWILKADRVICVSGAARARFLEYLQSHFRSTVVKRAVARTVVVYDGLRTLPEPARKETLRRELGIPAASKVVGIVGQVTPEKGIRDFVDAASQVHEKCRPAHFLVVGADPAHGSDYASETRAYARSIGLGDCFTFTGFRDDAARLLGCLDVSVLASRQDAFPRVVLESLSAGVPVVATRVGGVPEMIENGSSGLLVPSRDPASLADGILSILAMTSEDRAAMVARGRERVGSFGIAQHVWEVQKIYERLLWRRYEA